MKIHVFSTCWNEILMLPYFIRHYEPIVDCFVILDDGSTDGSLEFLKRHPKVQVRSCHNRDGSYIERSRDFWNLCWKESRGDADWVINCNIDEHLYHKDLIGYLKRCRDCGITILPALGYEMISHDFPSVKGRLCDTLVLGSPTGLLSGPSAQLSKIIIFNPNAIEEMNYLAGRHKAEPKGIVVFPEKTELKILHYKFLGLKYLERRYSELKQGLSIDDVAKKWGSQYFWDQSELNENFKMVEAKAVIAANPNFPRGLLSFIRLLQNKIMAKLLPPTDYFDGSVRKASQKPGGGRGGGVL